MSRRRWRPDTRIPVELAQDRGFLIVKSESTECAQDYYEACQDAGLPALVVAIPRTSAVIELFAIPGQKLSGPAQERIREHAGDAMRGSVARNRSITVDGDGGIIRGVHRDRARDIAGQIAAVLRDESSYRDGKVLVFPGGSRTGGPA